MTERKRITMERTFNASLEDVWEMWTTKDGIESWWGPDGFEVEVSVLDVRPGGELKYAMVAKAPEMVAFMKNAGMPTSSPCHARFTEVVPNARLRYVHSSDFIPGVVPYDVETVVELHKTAKGVRMVLTFDAMHDDTWTERAVSGWENELNFLGDVLAARRAP